MGLVGRPLVAEEEVLQSSQLACKVGSRLLGWTAPCCPRRRRRARGLTAIIRTWGPGLATEQILLKLLFYSRKQTVMTTLIAGCSRRLEGRRWQASPGGSGLEIPFLACGLSTQHQEGWGQRKATECECTMCRVLRSFSSIKSSAALKGFQGLTKRGSLSRIDEGP